MSKQGGSLLDRISLMFSPGGGAFGVLVQDDSGKVVHSGSGMMTTEELEVELSAAIIAAEEEEQNSSSSGTSP